MKKATEDEVNVTALLKRWDTLAPVEREVAGGILRRAYYSLSALKQAELRHKLAKEKDPLAKVALRILTRVSE